MLSCLQRRAFQPGLTSKFNWHLIASVKGNHIILQRGLLNTVYDRNSRLGSIKLQYEETTHRRWFSSQIRSEIFESKADPGDWRQDPQFQHQRKRGLYKCDRGRNRTLKLRLFSPLEYPRDFVLHWSMFLITIYYAFNLTPGETLPERKHRFIRQQLLQEAGLTENDLDNIESASEHVPLSEVDSEEHARVMDPYMEPKSGGFTATLLQKYFKGAEPYVEEDPSMLRHPAFIGYQHHHKRFRQLPAEIKHTVAKDDEQLIEELLKCKEINKNLSPITQDAQEIDLRLPRPPKRDAVIRPKEKLNHRQLELPKHYVM